MYKGLVLTSRGAEDISSREVSELIKADDIRKEDAVVKFNFKELFDLCRLCYRAQSVKKVLMVISEFKVHRPLADTSIEFKKSLESADFSYWLSGSFAE